MSTITKPMLLDETGQKMVQQLKLIAERVDPNYGYANKTWSITIDTAVSSPALPTMGGDVTSWRIYRSKIGRYLLVNGNAYKLDKNNSKLMADETEVDETQGDIMVRLPRLYYKVDSTTTSGTIVLTMGEKEFAEDCEVLDEQWVGAYLGYVASGKLRSRSGVNPTKHLSISQFWSYAQANGTNFGLVNYEQRKMMMIIYLCEFLNLNSQSCLGNGMTGDGDNWCSVVQNAVTGKTAGLGDSCGKVMFTEGGQTANNASHVSLFGIEDPYGWLFEVVQGCFFGSSNNSESTGANAYIYTNNRMPDSNELAEDFSNSTLNKRTITRVLTNGWLKTIIGGSKFDVLAATLDGSSTTYWSDYNYANTIGQLLLGGGSASAGSYCGLACSNSSVAFSGSGSSIGARLAYYGQVAIAN